MYKNPIVPSQKTGSFAIKPQCLISCFYLQWSPCYTLQVTHSHPTSCVAGVTVISSWVLLGVQADLSLLCKKQALLKAQEKTERVQIKLDCARHNRRRNVFTNTRHVFLFLYGNILTGTKKGALKEDLLLEKGWNGGVEARRSWERWWMAELG